MMLKKSIGLLCCLFFIIPVNAMELDSSFVMNTIRAKCRGMLLSETPYATEQSYRLTDDIVYDTDAKGYFLSLTDQGNWTDIDYNSQMRSAWTPSWHLYRVMLMCRAYHRNSSPAYLKAIHQAMDFWIKNDFKCDNWWQNNINVPFAFSSIVMMLGDEANQKEGYFLDNVIVKRIPVYRATGQNLIWQLDNEARIAIIHGQYAQLKQIFKRMQSVITITSAEGIQPDYSFHQHGAMLQFGNYGMHFINSLLFWMKIAGDSPLAFDQEKKNILFDYFSKGLRWTVFNKAMDITAVGRQLRSDCGEKRGTNLSVNAQMIESLTGDDTSKYKLDGFSEKKSRIDHISTNKSFWRSNYMIQSNPGTYMMSVKMHGNAVKRIEAINGENLKGVFLNDGVTLIQRTGKEYKNIAALWNWSMLPGTTTDTSMDVKGKLAISSANNKDFVGQVSDGENGFCVMDYDRAGLKAKKSYFFVNGMMIALGAGIEYSNMENVLTNVEQKLIEEKDIPYVSERKLGYPSHIWLDSVGYFFPSKNEKVGTTVEMREGNWGDIDLASGNKPVKGKIFSAFITHKNRSSYAYAIRPGISKNDAANYAKSPGFKVLRNDTSMQCIATEGRIMISFYKQGRIKLSGMDVQVNHPCLIICQKKNRDNLLFIADPTGRLKEMELTINGRFMKTSFPQGDFKGSTKKLIL